MLDLLGVRIIKTSIAVTIAIGLAQLLDFPYPFFAGMTAIISMDATTVLSLKMARNRVIGTLLGALIGMGLSYIARGNALLCGVGTFILIKICNRLKINGAIGIGGIVMFAIMVHTDKTPLYYAIHRTLPTILGGIVAVCVNYLIFPNHTMKKMEDLIYQMWDISSRIMNHIGNNSEDLNQLHKDLKMIESNLLKYEGDRIFLRRKELVEKCENEYQALYHLYHEAIQLNDIDQELYPEVYEYHLDKANQIYQMHFKD